MKVLFALCLVGVVWFGADGKPASLTLLPDAVQSEGARCLDGSPTGYFLREGSGDGVTKWILHLEGGGWCNSTEACYQRSKQALGSSKKWPKVANLPGLLSDNATVNPAFYTWNSVYIMYCDGASFAGYVEDPKEYKDTMLYYRGRANLKASLTDLLSMGMNKATDVILTGCSAGGLATFLHADAVAEFLPKTVKKYRAVADAGYFIDTNDIHMMPSFRTGVQHVFKQQNVSAGVNQDCIKAMPAGDEWKCFFATYSYNFIKTPFFVLNSMYDTAQIGGLFGLPCFPPKCSNDYLEAFYNYGEKFIQQAEPVFNSSDSNGYYIDSCLIHCQTLFDEPWSTFSINGVKMREAIAYWYDEATPQLNTTRLMDCENPYNCDRSCPNGPYNVEGIHDHLTELFTI